MKDDAMRGIAKTKKRLARRHGIENSTLIFDAEVTVKADGIRD